MEKEKVFENYPKTTVLLSALLSLAIYAIGLYVMSGIGILWSAVFLLFILAVEFNVLRKSCVNCYYYGKTCAFGRSKVCPVFFKKGDPKKFAKKEVSWIAILPDFLVMLIPLAAGIWLLIQNFSFILLGLLVALLLLSFWGNAVIRSQFACNHCKQRGLGCPAQKMFEKAGKKK
jgi:hypothetical protein